MIFGQLWENTPTKDVNPQAPEGLKVLDGINRPTDTKGVEEVDLDPTAQAERIIWNPETMRENIKDAANTDEREALIQKIGAQNPNQVYPPLINEIADGLKQRDSDVQQTIETGKQLESGNNVTGQKGEEKTEDQKH